MSEQLPERADVRQLRIQAKELLRRLSHGEETAEGINPTTAKLADAQRLIARKYGFSSWPRLVEEAETPALLEAFQNAVQSGDAEALDRLFRTKPKLRKHVNDPIFSFDSPALVQVSHHAKAKELIPILIRNGADPNRRTDWWAGGFGVLDHANEEVADLLINLGARLDVWSAAAHGRLDDLREMLDKDPALVSAPGGDGMTPLHFAKDKATAELLISKGAELEKKDVDHEGTPIQCQIGKPEVVRLLLEHGAKPDIYTAVALDDADLLRKIIDQNPSEVDTHIGKDPYRTVHSNGGHIYAYTVGPTMTPHQYAARLGHKKVGEVLLEHASPARKLVVAAWQGDEATVDEILAKNPEAGKQMGPEARAITDAAGEGRIETVRLLLKAGVDPATPGMDSGSALHTACWFGYLEVVKLLVNKVPLDLCDDVHGSPPLGWACHGAQWCRNIRGNYTAVVETLIAHGADVNAPANKFGVSMSEQAGKRDDVKAILRRYGAR